MANNTFIGVKRFTTEQIITGIRSDNSEILDWIQDNYVPVTQQYLKDLKWKLDDAKSVFSRTLNKIKHQIQFKKIAANKSFKAIFEDRMRMAWMDTISGYMAEALMTADSKVIRQFDQIIRPVVWSMVKKYKQNTDDAEEVYQKAFFRVIKNIKAGKYTENDTFKSYFLSIVTNILREGGRGNSKYVDYEDYFENNDPADDDDYEFYQNHEDDLNRLEELLNQANERCIEIFKLFYWQKMRIQKIADMLEISLDNAKKRLSRCRQKLRDNF